MAEAAQGKTRDEVDSGRRTEEHGTSDQVIDPWCEPCLEETSVKVSADWYCPECNNHLCLSCKDFHKKWPMLQNHRLVQGSRMPKYHADKPIKYPNCASHAVNITDYFCLNHSHMVCSDCIKRDHQSCDFLPIPDVCKSLGLKDITRFKNVVNDIQQNVKNTQTTLHQNIACIESQKRDIIKIAEIERDKLILKASEMFEETVTTISETCLKITTELTNGIETLSDENRQLNEIIDTIDKKTISDIDANIFVQIQNMVISTNECKQEIEDTVNQLRLKELSFALNENLCRFVDETKLGHTEEISKPVGTMKDLPNIAFPQRKAKKYRSAMDITKINAKKMSCFNARTAQDKETCLISGMVLTGNGKLVIADANNKSLKFFSDDNKLLTTFDMPKMIYDIAIIDDSEVIVCSVDKKLHFVDISALPLVKIRKSISIRCLAARLTSCGDNIFVASHQTNPASLKMIDRNGNDIWDISTGQDNQQLFEKQCGILTTAFYGARAVMITDWKKQTLTLVDVNRRTVLQIIDLKGKSVHGLTVDDDGNIFICSKNTREILVLSNDLSQSQVLLKDNDLQSGPVNILYRKSTGELYVSYYKSDVIDRFILSMMNE